MESFQLLFFDVRKDLKVRVGLRFDKNAPFRTKIFEERFVKTKRPYYAVIHVGLWPDPLVPVDAGDYISLSKGMIYALWLDLYTPPGTPPGDYKASLIIEDDSGHQLYSFPVEIKVWDFDLPVRPSLTTAFDVYSQFFPLFFTRKKGEPYNLWKSRLEKVEFSLYELMLEYKMSPMLKIDPKQQGFPEIMEHFIEKGLNGFAFGKYGGSYGNNWPKDKDALMKLIPLYRDYATILRNNNLLDIAYLYTWDEGKIGDPRVKEVTKMIHSADRELRNMVCYHGFWDPEAVPGWGDDIDIWCFQIGSYNEVGLRKLRGLGMDIWLYVSGPDGITPNLVIDSMGIEHRIIPWMLYNKDISGFLYWAVNFWQGGNPWENTFNTPWQQNGNGLLFYPFGDRIVPTIRAAMFRDGMDDYEYLKALGQIPDERLGLKERQEKRSLLDMDVLCPSFKRYSHDPEQLLQRRQQIGEFLDRFYSGEMEQGGGN